MHLLKLILGNHLHFARDGADAYSALTGTVTLTNGDATLTGSGTTFTTQVAVDDVLYIGGVEYTVLSITNNTALELTENYTGSTTAGLALYLAGAASSTNKPAAAPDANWTRIGSILDCEPKNTLDEDEVLAPSPGSYEVEDIITKSKKLMLDLTVQDGSEALFEMLFMADGAITAAYAPMAGSGTIKGWWRLKQYDQGDDLRNTLLVWGKARVEAQKFDANLVRYKLSLRVLANALNEGTLALS